jgi:hypothetical protein
MTRMLVEWILRSLAQPQVLFTGKAKLAEGPQLPSLVTRLSNPFRSPDNRIVRSLHMVILYAVLLAFVIPLISVDFRSAQHKGRPTIVHFSLVR